MTQRKSFTADGVQFAWDSTSIKAYSTCARKYQYEILEGWEPKFKSPHLVFGGHVAKALERFHKFLADDMDYDDAVAETVRLAFIDTWHHKIKDGERVPGTGGPWQSDQPTKTRETLIRTIIWYLDTMKDTPTQPVMLSNGKPAVEMSFSIELTDNIMLCGHMDQIVEHAGYEYVMDQKTTKNTITPRFFEGFKPDDQTAMYTFIGKHYYHNPVRGMLIDGIQIGVNFARFERGFVLYGENELKEWVEEKIIQIDEAQQRTRAGHFPMNRTACDNYGGCPFRRVCSQPPHLRENYLKGDYQRTKSWDPLERR